MPPAFPPCIMSCPPRHLWVSLASLCERSPEHFPSQGAIWEAQRRPHRASAMAYRTIAFHSRTKVVSP